MSENRLVEKWTLKRHSKLLSKIGSVFFISFSNKPEWLSSVLTAKSLDGNYFLRWQSVLPPRQVVMSQWSKHGGQTTAFISRDCRRVVQTWQCTHHSPSSTTSKKRRTDLTNISPGYPWCLLLILKTVGHYCLSISRCTYCLPRDIMRESVIATKIIIIINIITSTRLTVKMKGFYFVCNETYST